MSGARPLCLVAAACLACGARTALSAEGADAGATVDAPPTAVTLAIPLGTYAGCASSTVTTRPNFVGVSGRDGTLTLSREGDAVVAALDFPTYAGGRVAFVPTTATTAAFRAAQAFEVQIASAGAGAPVVTVTATTGALSLVGPTLFLSTRGRAGGDEVSTFFHCRVPAGVPPTEVVTNAPPPGRVTPGVYRSCVATSSTQGPARAGSSGVGGPLTVAAFGAGLRLSWEGALLPELARRGFDFGAGPVTAALTAGQTCDVREPCGPPPTLGMSPFPSTATLAELRGSMIVNGDGLFVDLVGDAGAAACGVHDLSITCAGM
jgi:hypothetical protein